MKTAIHQPHYFAWTGYLNKIASVDKFILMDDVQLTDSSYMYRHRLLAYNGTEKYITIPFVKENYKHIKYKDIHINNSIKWQNNHINFITENYKKSKYFDKIINLLLPLYNKKYLFLCDVCIDSILLLMRLFDIETKIVRQSDLNYDSESKKNNLVLELCRAVNADYYLSGTGAKKYMELIPFQEAGISVEFQNYIQPEYKQLSSNNFISGLSSLDMLFSIGIDNSKKLFWESM